MSAKFWAGAVAHRMTMDTLQDKAKEATDDNSILARETLSVGTTRRVSHSKEVKVNICKRMTQLR
eukprot:scaffold362871_cov33-Prasinocladus_malaysianus.AAC.2